MPRARSHAEALDPARAMLSSPDQGRRPTAPCRAYPLPRAVRSRQSISSSRCASLARRSGRARCNGVYTVSPDERKIGTFAEVDRNQAQYGGPWGARPRFIPTRRSPHPLPARTRPPRPGSCLAMGESVSELATGHVRRVGRRGRGCSSALLSGLSPPAAGSPATSAPSWRSAGRCRR